MNKNYIIIGVIVLLLLITVKAKAATKPKDPMQIFPNSIGFKTKNPTNINANNGGSYKGEIGVLQTSDGIKRVFESVDYGCLAASERLKDRYFIKGLNTIEKIAPVWTGGHSTQSWINAVSKISGFSPSEYIGSTSSNMRKLVKGMVFAENSVVLMDYYLRLI
jgi:hypothetical protein